MDNLTLHPHVTRSLRAYRDHAPHGLLLSGMPGVGLGTIARHLANQSAHQLLIEPDEKGTIGIETIHKLYAQTKSSRKQETLHVIIDDAEKMSSAAQNALLKLLEEPVVGVYFVLTSHFAEGLLATIRSRTANIEVRPVDIEASQQHVTAAGTSISPQKMQQLLFIAAGRPAELTRLLQDEARFTEAAALVRDARTMLGTDTYEKILIAYRYDKSRERAINLVDMMFTLVRFSLLSKQETAALAHEEALERAATALKHNGHVRTHLMAFATSPSASVIL